MAAATVEATIAVDPHTLFPRLELNYFLQYTLAKNKPTDVCGVTLKSDNEKELTTTVAAVAPNGLAEKSGLEVGLQVVSINGKSAMMGATAVASYLKSLAGPVVLKCSVPSTASAAAASNEAAAVSADAIALVEETKEAAVSSSSSTAKPAEGPKMKRSASFSRRLLTRAASFGRRPASSTAENDGDNTNRTDDSSASAAAVPKMAIRRTASFGRKVQKTTTHTVCIERNTMHAPLNFCLSRVPGVGAVVTEVDAGSAVASAGLKVGDVVVGVNSASELTTPSEVTAILSRVLGEVELRVVRHHDKNNGLPKGWKSTVEAGTGRTLFYEIKKTTSDSGNRPFTVGPIRKAKGAGTGIGLQNDDDDREGTNTVIAYVKEGSLFEGQLSTDDEILEVNGVSVKGKAKHASKAIVEAESITLLVQSRRWCARTTYQNPTVMPVKALAKPRPLREISAVSVQPASVFRP